MLAALAAGCRPAPVPPVWSAGPAGDAAGGVVIESVKVEAAAGAVAVTLTYSPGGLPPPEAVSFRNTVLRQIFPRDEYPVHSRVAIALPGAWGFDPRRHPGGELDHELVARVAVEDGPEAGTVVLVLDLHRPVAISFTLRPERHALTVRLDRVE